MHCSVCREPPRFNESGLDPSRANVAEDVTPEGCLALHKEALSRVMPVGLVYGNASPDDAKRIWKKVMLEETMHFVGP